MHKLFKDFDWKNGKFNAAQENYLKAFAANQTENFLTGATDEAIAEKHLLNVYAGLKKPMPKIVWFDSPAAMVMSVRDSVRASVGDSVRDSVWASVRDSVWASVGDSVGDSVWASVGASVGASVWDSVGDSVGASVWASVGDSVGDSVWDSVRSYDVAGWSSFYKFWSEELTENQLEDWCLYSEQVSGGLLTDDTAYLVRKPKRLVRGVNGRLDFDHGKAIEWNDGYGFYYLRGVEFDEKTWVDIVEQKVTLTTLGKIENADQRAIAVQMLKPELLLKQVKAKLINTGKKDTKLYEVKNFMGTGSTEYCMHMQHPSIKGTSYIEWVEPKIGKLADADLAQATAFQIPLEDYLAAVEA